LHARQGVIAVRDYYFVIISSLFIGFPGTFPLEPVVNPTTQASIIIIIIIIIAVLF
jgi:hypothetical protein